LGAAPPGGLRPQAQRRARRHAPRRRGTTRRGAQTPAWERRAWEPWFPAREGRLRTPQLARRSVGHCARAPRAGRGVPVLCPEGPGTSAWCLARSASDVAPRRPLWACIKQGTSGIPRALGVGRGAWGPCARAVAVAGARCNCRARCGASGTVLRRRVDLGANVGRGVPARRAAELPNSGRRRLRAGGAPGRSVLRLEGSGPTEGPGPGGSRAPIPTARRPTVRCRPPSRIENLLTLCQSAMRLTWGSRRMAVVRWHMRGDRGNAFPRWPVSTSEAARHLLTMAKTLARCSCRRDYDGSLHVTALTLADLKSHQKLHLGRPDES
jgi:hypothetical protein